MKKEKLYSAYIAVLILMNHCNITFTHTLPEQSSENVPLLDKHQLNFHVVLTVHRNKLHL